MIRLKNAREIDGIRRSGRLLARALAALAAETREGITTRDLDVFVRAYLSARGARPSFLGYLDFPAAVCISVNEEVIHGIPGPRRLRDGDLVSLDLGVDLEGYFTDAAVTVAIGRASPARRRLLETTRTCLERAVAAALPGNRVSDVSRAVFDLATSNGFGVVREYCGHGVGFSPHEDPQVPNYVGGGPNPRLKEGMVLAIEPMINAGTGDIELLEDGWTVVTADGADSAHFEHTIVVTGSGMEIMTRLE
jgi:methionyl aminopeptidase